MSKTLKDSMIIGFAIFAVFFGAGNLIFPPYIGLASGSHWGIAVIGLALSGILLPLISIIAVQNMGGSLQALTRPIAPWFFNVYMLIVLLMGISMTIPRTAGVAFEVGFKGIFPNAPPYSVYLFLIAYFAVTYCFANDRKSVIDNIGKLLTPVLLVSLIFIIIMAIVKPLGVPAGPGTSSPFANAFITGYQTGDILTGLRCGVIFIEAIKGKGYADPKSTNRVTLISVSIAALGLCIVYGGLLYLGATGAAFFPQDTDQTDLLVGLVRKLIGSGGIAVLSIGVSLACLTTTIGLITAAADFLSGLSGNKISFKMCVGILSTIGIFVASIGVKAIIGYAYPIFMLLYPTTIIMTLLGVFNKFVPNEGAWKGAITMTVLIGLYDCFDALNIIGAINVQTPVLDSLIDLIPLSGTGLTWIVPAVAGFAGGALIKHLMNKAALPR